MQRKLLSTAAAFIATVAPTAGAAQAGPSGRCLMGFAAAADSSPAVVYGYSDLQDPLASGVPELRITHSAGLVLQRYTLRLVEQGSGIHGELLVSWPTIGYHRVVQGPRDCGRSTEAEDAHLANLVAHDAPGLYGCREIVKRGVFQFCQARFRSEPQWSRVLGRLEALGVWTLPDPAKLAPAERLVLDGHGIKVELRDSAGFRHYAYRNPQAQPWPEARAAEQIDAIVQEVVSAAGGDRQ